MNTYLKAVTLILGLLTCFSSSSQNENRPWYIGVGYNVVDYYPNGEGAVAEYGVKPYSDVVFQGFFNTNHYNIEPLALKFTVGRYIRKNLNVELSASFNTITEWGNIPMEELRNYPSYAAEYGGVDELGYFGVGLLLKYSFRNALNPQGWADPFVGLGGGITLVEIAGPDDDFLGAGNVDFAAGLGIWISERLSLVYQTSFKKIFYDVAYKDFTDSHFQHSLGIKYIFNFEIGSNNCYTFK